MTFDADAEFQLLSAYWNDRLVDIVWSDRAYATGRCRVYKKTVPTLLAAATKEIVLVNVLLENGSWIRELTFANIREHDPTMPKVKIEPDPDIPF